MLLRSNTEEATFGTSHTEQRRLTLAGAQLATFRYKRGLSQTEASRPAAFTRSYLSHIETGRKSVSELAVGKLNRLIRGLGLNATEERSLQAAIAVDDICTNLCDGAEDTARRLLWSPLRESETRLLRHALSKYPVAPLHHPILPTPDRAQAIESLKSLVELVADSDDPRDISVRNQAVYHLSRSEAHGVNGLLADLAKSEPEPVVKRSIAVGKALLADSRPLHDYIDRLRSDPHELRLNLGYMGWYSGERHVSYVDAYSFRGDWSGEVTLDWLLEDFAKSPALSELNLLSIRALLREKDHKGLCSAPSRAKELGRILRQLDTNITRPNTGLREDIHVLGSSLRPFI